MFTLRTIYDWVLAEHKDMHVTFIDYSVTFNSVGQKFLDKTLQREGASAKTRNIFRSIYSVVNARTAISDVDGETVFSDAFPIRRGVVQGDITSPIYFILVLELILELHDKHPQKGINLGSTRVHTLGYADDAALLDYDIAISTARVTAIAQGSWLDADMQINVKKTKVMHVREQGMVSKTTVEEAERVCKFKCPHIGCTRIFYNKHGMKCHAVKCKWKDDYLIKRIAGVRGPPRSSRQEFLIKWKGYGCEHDCWRPRCDVDPDCVADYLKANGLYDYNWPGVRCPHCYLPCKSERGLKIHLKACRYVDEAQQNFTGTAAARKVRRDKVDEAQKQGPTVECEEKALENVFSFKYLGSYFTADGDHKRDVERRCAMAMNRCGELRAVFGSHIPLGLKIKIYKTAVCSLLTYGSEAWRLDEKTTAMINGCNARCLSHITHQTAHAEASPRTRTYDLVADIRRRRYKWLGHILRMQGHRFVKEPVRAQSVMNLPGSITMNFPDYTFDELTTLARNRDGWRSGGSSLKSVPKRQHGISRAHLRRGLKPNTRSISIALSQTQPHRQSEPRDMLPEMHKHEAFLRPPDSNARELKRQRQA